MGSSKWKKRGEEIYKEVAELTFALVERAKSTSPAFAMPPSRVGIIASLADVGRHLARNGAARELLKQLLRECDRRKLGDYPTVMMLYAALEVYDIPVIEVPFEKLGIKGRFIMRGRRGSA